MSEFVIAMMTVPADFDATSLAQDVVASGLAACVTIVPGARSVYNWKGVPQVDEEQQLFIKTTTDHVDGLWDLLSDRHPYDVPEFLVMPIVDGSEEYFKWIDRSVGPKAES